MSKPIVHNVPIDSIDHNPFRDTGKYPFVERKIEALKRSIAEVGLWVGINARENGNRYELAFGHHRYEAARQLGLTNVDIVVADLTDEQMLGYMGRENMEDYNADFLIMLETWEAARQWIEKSRDFSTVQAIDVAILLGWNIKRPQSAGRQEGQAMMSRTADACNAAHSLLKDGHINRVDLVDLTVHEAREILTRAAANIARIDKAGKALGTPAAHTKAAKDAVAKAVKTTAKQSREGVVANKDLRGRVDVNAYKHAASSKMRQTPLFDMFGKALANGIRKMLKSDITAEKLNEVIKALPQVRDEADKIVVRRLVFELGELANRASGHQNKLEIGGSAKVIPLSIAGGTTDA